MVTDKVVFGYAICAWFHGAWKRGAKRRSSEGLDGQCREDAVWWALMHILEEWAKKSQRKRKRTDDTPRPTPKKPTSSGPSGKPGPSGQLEPLTPDCFICTPAVDPTPAADPTRVADPTPGVRPPVIECPFALFRFALFRFTLFRFAVFWFALFRCALLPWQTPWVDCFVAGCRVQIITTHRQNGW